jgi:hypothetical protein
VIFSLERLIAGHGSRASSQARTAGPRIAKRALTRENCPENGSSMQVPIHSGPAQLTMMLLTPTVRRPILPSSRIVWASKPPSMNTRLTPGVVPKSKPKTNLWLNHCVLVGLPTRNNGSLPVALPIKAATSLARFCWQANRSGWLGSPVWQFIAATIFIRT